MTTVRENLVKLVLLGCTLALSCLAACASPEPSHSPRQATKDVRIDCSELNFDLTTTLNWTSVCNNGVVGLRSDDLPEVKAQLLSTDAEDPLMVILAMLRTMPGIYDVELHLTNVGVCGSITCLSYEANFRRLSKSIERFGVIAVGDTGSWEFTTSYETSPDHLSLKRPLALHVLDDLTQLLHLPES